QRGCASATRAGGNGELHRRRARVCDDMDGPPRSENRREPRRHAPHELLHRWAAMEDHGASHGLENLRPDLGWARNEKRAGVDHTEAVDADDAPDLDPPRHTASSDRTSRGSPMTIRIIPGASRSSSGGL